MVSEDWMEGEWGMNVRDVVVVVFCDNRWCIFNRWVENYLKEVNMMLRKGRYVLCLFIRIK